MFHQKGLTMELVSYIDFCGAPGCFCPGRQTSPSTGEAIPVLPPTNPPSDVISGSVPQPYERGSLLQDSHRSDQGPQFTKHFSLSERGLVIFLKMERNRHKGVLVLIKNKPNRSGDQLEELGRRPTSRAGPQSLMVVK